jgi:transcriptional regulator with XRE-family HTH domain
MQESSDFGQSELICAARDHGIHRLLLKVAFFIEELPNFLFQKESPEGDTTSSPRCLFAIRLNTTKPTVSSYPHALARLGDHLRKKRLDVGLLQKEVGQTLGVTACTVRYWETGRAFPAIKHIPRIIEFLGYSPFNKPETLAERLVQRRRSLGLSRKQTAKLLGIDPSNLAGWETGKHRPTKKSESVIQRFFDWDLS